MAEVPMVYTTDGAKNIDLKEGQWVRIKKGLYAGDVAMVQDFDESKTRIQVKLVPRLFDDAGFDNLEADGEENN